MSPEKAKRTMTSQYRYQMDTYVEHLGCMWTCWRKPFKTTSLKNGEPEKTIYNSVRHELLKSGGKFIKNKIFTQVNETEAEALFESLVFFAIFTHDLGKLQVKWQEVMREWQAIADSWRSMTRLLAQSLPLPEANLSKDVYIYPILTTLKV